MTIPTMEALEALSVGEQITLTRQDGSRLWTRNEEGFVNGEVLLLPEELRPEVESGTVTHGVRMERRQMRVNQGQWYTWVTFSEDVSGRTRWHGIRFYTDGSVYGDVYEWEDRASTMTGFGRVVQPGEDGAPDWFTVAWTYLARQYGERVRSRHTEQQQHARTVERLEERAAGRDTELSEAKARFEDAILEWMNDNGEDRGSALAAILDQHGFRIPPPETETITVDVEVTGRSLVSVDDAHELLGFSVSGDVSPDTLGVDWEHELSFSVEVDEGDCGCDQITRAMVVEKLTESGIPSSGYSSVGYDAECPNC
jgi:hypothetical protein